MKSWNFLYHTCAGLCLLIISTTSYTHILYAAGLPANTHELGSGAIWLPHRAKFPLPENDGRTLFKVNTHEHSLPTKILTQCGYKSFAKMPGEDEAPQLNRARMQIKADKAAGQAVPWPGKEVTRDVKRHAIVYQTTSTPSFSFPRTKTDLTLPPSCLYFFRLNNENHTQGAATDTIPQATQASQLVLKLTRTKGKVRYDPLYFELSSPLVAASSPSSTHSEQKLYNIALILNSSALYRTASTTTHQFGYFHQPWALVFKNLELSPDAPCQITWDKASLTTSHCTKSNTLQILMPTYPTQLLPQFDQSFLLPQHGSDKPDQFPAEVAPIPDIPPAPIVFAMLTTLESGFTPYWRNNLKSLTMLSGPDRTSKIFTQTLTFLEQGS